MSRTPCPQYKPDPSLAPKIAPAPFDSRQCGERASPREHFVKDMFLCELLQAAHGGLLELHQTLTGTGILHLNLPLTLLCNDIPQLGDHQ